jgi:glutaredoxin
MTNKSGVTIYTAKQCPVCERVKQYLKHQYGSFEEINAEDNYSDFINKVFSLGRHDLEWQGGKLPLVYIDDKYIDLDEVLREVNAWEFAQMSVLGKEGRK